MAKQKIAKQKTFGAFIYKLVPASIFSNELHIKDAIL